jgi:hypothetical protein
MKHGIMCCHRPWGAWNSISDPEIKSVTDQWEIKKSYALKADSIAQKLRRELEQGSNSETIDHFYVFNTSSWQRSDVVKITKSIKGEWNSVADDKGKTIATQKLKNGDIVFSAMNIPPFGFKKYIFTKSKNEEPKNSSLINYTISNSFYNISLDQNTSAVNSLRRSDNNFNYVDDNNGLGINQFIHTGKNGENQNMLKPENNCL